jgi:putative flippase GtrA
MTDLAPRANANLLPDLCRFAVAGAVGFAVDLAVLFAIIVWLGEPPLLARLGSFTAALVTTWLINRFWTFRRRTGAQKPREVSHEFARYSAVALTAGVANYTVYALLILAAVTPGPRYLVVALAAGVAAGMIINFVGARNFVFARRR